MLSFSLPQFSFLIFTYLISSIPFGLLISKFFAKQDIRKHGSKNIGATNVARVVGKKLGFATLILDGIKGAAMVIIARQLFCNVDNLNLFLSFVGATAVLGHIFPIYIKFKGGKGVATTLAVLLAINPIIGIMACVTWLIIFLAFKISSISSIFSIMIAAFFAIHNNLPKTEIILCIFLAILILIRHKENVSRLIKGKENNFK